MQAETKWKNVIIKIAGTENAAHIGAGMHVYKLLPQRPYSVCALGSSIRTITLSQLSIHHQPPRHPLSIHEMSAESSSTKVKKTGKKTGKVGNVYDVFRCAVLT